MRILFVLFVLALVGCGEQAVEESISEKLISEFNTVKSQKKYESIMFLFPDINESYGLVVTNVSLEKLTGLLTISGVIPRTSNKTHLVLDSKLITSYFFIGKSTEATFFIHTKCESKTTE